LADRRKSNWKSWQRQTLLAEPIHGRFLEFKIWIARVYLNVINAAAVAWLGGIEVIDIFQNCCTTFKIDFERQRACLLKKGISLSLVDVPSTYSPGRHQQAVALARSG